MMMMDGDKTGDNYVFVPVVVVVTTSSRFLYYTEKTEGVWKERED
jgi:hypothetical protein